MNPEIFVLFSLALDSLLLTVILAIGWRMFSRPRHAATWAVAFGLATAEWSTDLAAVTAFASAPILYLGSATLAAAFAMLLLLGFRERANLATAKVWLFTPVAATSIATAAILYMIPGLALRAVPALVLWAVAMVFCATSIVGRRGLRNGAEKTAIVVLICYALIAAALAGFGIVTYARGAGRGIELYREILLLAAPTGFVALGLAAVFLLAADLAETMRLLATMDPLTGILNRRGLAQAARQAIANCQRQRQPLAAVVADLDRFKAINDRFGHAVGDVALQTFTRHVCRALRSGDPVGRLGGEEFGFLLVNTSAQAALDVVERIRAGMATLVINGAGDSAITASFGVAPLKPGESSLDELLERADTALYASKQAGRNRVTLADA